MDQIQKRYGWTDEVVYKLPFTRFLEICETIVKARQDEAKEQMTLAAFVGWQEARLWGYKHDYMRYLQDLGLLEKRKPAPAELRWEKSQALVRAAKIVEMDKRRKAKVVS